MFLKITSNYTSAKLSRKKGLPESSTSVSFPSRREYKKKKGNAISPRNYKMP